MQIKLNAVCYVFCPNWNRENVCSSQNGEGGNVVERNLVEFLIVEIDIYLFYILSLLNVHPRYSPSVPMDEDEANQQSGNADENAANRSTSSKSSVLGKAQAKKRLMAFSISKQAAAAAAQLAAKKQATQTGGRDKKENGGEPATGKAGSDEANETTVFDEKHAKKRQKKSKRSMAVFLRRRLNFFFIFFKFNLFRHIIHAAHISNRGNTEVAYSHTDYYLRIVLTITSFCFLSNVETRLT